MNIGILTGGGDCPGLNSAIRMIAKRMIHEQGARVFGFFDGFRGIIEQDYTELDFDTVSNILDVGGTILGTSNKFNPFAVYTDQGVVDKSDEAVKFLSNLNIDCLFTIGGDGTQSIASKMFDKGIPVVGVPKTIDNDLMETDITIGFLTAASFVSDSVMRVRSTAESHHRCLVVETMGRYAGWLALYGGSASGADVILIPEIQYHLDTIAEFVEKRVAKGRKYSIIVVSEGVKRPDGSLVVRRKIGDSPDPLRLGGIGEFIAKEIEDRTGIESRVTVLGHLQRGGRPIPQDRILASRFAYYAVDLCTKKRFGELVVMKDNQMTSVKLKDVENKQKKVPPNDPILLMERSIGTCFGDRS